MIWNSLVPILNENACQYSQVVIEVLLVICLAVNLTLDSKWTRLFLNASTRVILLSKCDGCFFDLPSGPVMKQPQIFAGFDHLSNKTNHIKHKHEHNVIHLELEALKKHWLPYVTGIHVVLMNPHNDTHLAVILMSKTNCLKERFNGVPVHLLFHQIFDFDFVKRKHYRICAVCNKKNKKSEGYMKCCTLCKQRRYCSKRCQKIDWNKRGHRRKCFSG